jgi:hypothetical protein
MSIRSIVLLFIAYCIAAVSCIGEAWLWLVNLNPSLPLVPACLCFLALLCAGMAGKYWNELDYIEEEPAK